MKITLSTASLKRALKDSARVAVKKSPSPVLSHVRIECQPNGVLLSVTDLEISRQEILPYLAPLDMPEDDLWSRAVSVKALEALLPKTAARVKASPVVILTPSESDDSEVREDALFVSVGGASTMLRTLPAEDFPTLPFAKPRYTGKRPTSGMLTCSEMPDPAVIPGDDYRQAIRKIFSSISTEESRFQLSGAFFELNGRLRVGATDGRRLSRAETDYRVSPDSADATFLVPRKALAVMLTDSAFGPVKRQVKVGVYKAGKCKGEDKFKAVQSWPDVHMTHTDHHVHFETPRGVRYVARILEGKYPAVDKLISKGKPELTITTDAENLRATMASISHMTGDRARAIRMELDGDLPVFSAANPDAGTSTAEMNGNTKMSGRLAWNRRKKVTEKARAKMSPHEIRCLEAIEATPESERVEHIGINPDYITACIGYMAPGDEVTLSLWCANSQMHVTGPDPSDVHVIMPIRL